MQLQSHRCAQPNGQDMSVVIDAPTASAAEEQANMMNILVERMDRSPHRQRQRHRQSRSCRTGRFGAQASRHCSASSFPAQGSFTRSSSQRSVWFLVVVVGYVCLIVPGIVLHVCCIVGATMGDPYKRAKGL